ncbi:polyphosphate kinase 1 [Desertivirga xinjiangensis]|uniref:polyphosphate kinase 1 n=1 Tax=Desertivirga xinjiangensis TaxID=539206 RepID=UPI00210EA225|nr:polyphosphate kinase 1 [Pedobacter xinjiangensis]
MNSPMSSFFNRDISWLSFNERLLTEAAKEHLPLLERLKFLSIFSSNLDEFYRVRMPAIRALHRLNKKKQDKQEVMSLPDVIEEVNETIKNHQQQFGGILSQLLPSLKESGVQLIYNEEIPFPVQEAASDYFFSHLLAYLHIVELTKDSSFFPENNKLYQLLIAKQETREESLYLVNIPSDSLPRFISLNVDNKDYILFIDDILRHNLRKLPQFSGLSHIYSMKVTRDAELEIADEYEGDLAEKIERQIEKRDFGFATRLLYEGGMPQEYLEQVTAILKLEKATLVEGGRYHNLKDFSDLPLKTPSLFYEKWSPLAVNVPQGKSLFDSIQEQDILINNPYQSYDSVIRFFNEAAVNPDVENIYITVYRLATDSRIASALITAAKNGKKVSVFVELKARFDEANNIKWSKKMKAAGIKIIYSIPTLKVHAKIALVTRKNAPALGIFSTGNFNEVTAAFYTDHVLLTANHSLLAEVEQLFYFLEKRRKPTGQDNIHFKHLLVAQFNLKDHFTQLIEREIENASKGLESGITIKLNNLEEEKMISLLYKASQAGVKIKLIVRGICRLIPGVAGLSENISVIRIIDRYLEHGRVFIFSNNGNTEMYLGSADWMYRNIYRRIEVCFPIYDVAIAQTLLNLINIQLQDNVQAVSIDSHGKNLPVENGTARTSSQEKIYQALKIQAEAAPVPVVPL